MKQHFKQKRKYKLNQTGIAHLAAPLLIVVVFMAVGTFWLVSSRADRVNAPCRAGYMRIDNRCKKMTSRQKVALEILQLADQGKIRFAPTMFQEIDRRDHTTPRQNIESAYERRKSLTTRVCDGRGGVPGRNASVYINVNLLRFIRDLGQETNYIITSITGQCHSSAKSQHYRGRAVDIGCPFSDSQVRLATSIGAKYGIKPNGETCADRDPHYHFSVGGR